MTTPRPQPRGYLLIDVIFAISLVALVIVILGAAMSQQHRAAARLADRRAAARLAERALTSLQTGQIADEAAHVRPLGDATPAGVWVEVRVRQGRETAQLIGLVPAGSVSADRQPEAAP